jgi:uncharacterized membrane protein YgcG
MLRPFGAALLLLLTLGAGSAIAAEVIQRFDSAVQVAKDGTLTVTETIRLRAENLEIKRGIHRDFPLTYTDAAGRLHEVGFELLDVTRDGQPEPHFTKRQGDILQIFAGKEDVILSRGDHTYVLRYSTTRQIRWFDGKPELNWNVTGNYWNFPILAASYRLEPIDGQRPLRFTAFTGRLGARGTDWRGAIDNAGVLTVNTTRALGGGEGLTVVAELSATAVDPPGPVAEFWYAVWENRRWIFGGAGFVLVVFYYFAAWAAVGRDPKRGIVIPLFHPPQGISPALANYIHNWGFAREKWRAFTAAALSLAVRGLITFDNKDGKIILKAKPGAAEGGPLPAGERTVFDWVKGQGLSAVIDSAHGEAVAKAGADFTKSIEAENRGRFFRRNLGYVVAGVALTIAVVIGVVIFGGLRDEDYFVMFGMAFGGFWLGLFLVPLLMTLFRASSFGSLVRSALSLIVIVALISAVVAIVRSMFPNGFGEALPALWAAIESYPFPVLLVSAFTMLNGLFIYLMRAPTALGRPIMDQLDGFRLYLETAESDRLNYQAPEFTAARFEALLPYAVALDVEKPWADAFAAAFQRAHPDADPSQHYQPVWASGGGWTGRDFGSAVSATVGSVSSALASAVPVSSSSSGFSSGGGGGGSGGGGGGGGGGGW